MKAIDIANLFIDYSAHPIDDTITNLKLNKLLYSGKVNYLLYIYYIVLFPI